MKHKNIPPGANHVPYSRVFANDAERTAYVPTADDEGKLALQTDTGFLWMMSVAGSVYTPFAAPTAAEIGAEPSGTATAVVAAHEAASDPHPEYSSALLTHVMLANPHGTDIADIAGLQTALDSKAALSHSHEQSEITGLTAALTTKANATDVYSKTESDARYPLTTVVYTKAETDTRIQAVIDAAPAALDTLNELAAALGDDPNFAATVTAELGLKADSADVYTQAQVDTALAGKSNVGHTHTPAEAGAEPAGAVAAHAAATDPHPQYLTEAEGDARYVLGDTLKARLAVQADIAGTTPLATGLKVTLQPNTTYVVEAFLRYQSTNTNIGVGFTVNGPVSPVFAVQNFDIPTSTTARTLSNQRAYNVSAAATSANVGSSDADILATMYGLIETGASGGDYEILMRSENATTVRLMPGSTLIAKAI